MFSLFLIDKRFIYSNNYTIRTELCNIYFNKPLFNIGKCSNIYHNNYHYIKAYDSGIVMCGRTFHLSYKTTKKIKKIIETEDGYFEESTIKYCRPELCHEFKPWKHTKILNFHIINGYVSGLSRSKGLVDLYDNKYNIICTLWIHFNNPKNHLSVDFIKKYLDFEP